MVVTRGDRNVAALEWFANHLAEFLARERKQRYSYDEFQTACTRTHTISESGKSSKTSFRFVAEREAAVTRQEAEELLEAWREFIKSDVKGRLHVALASHRGLTFLVSKEAPWIPVFSLERQRRVVERRASGAGAVSANGVPGLRKGDGTYAYALRARLKTCEKKGGGLQKGPGGRCRVKPAWSSG